MTAGANPENHSPHPIWEGAVVGFLFAAERGMIDRNSIIPTMSQLCTDLLQNDMLDDLGSLQSYLRQSSAFVQLVAMPFNKAEITQPNIRCIDVITGETRGHWLMVSVGENGSEAERQLNLLHMSHEVNETILRRDTGRLAI